MTETLVIGGAGFIGSWVVDTLVAHSHAVTVLDRADPPTYLSDHITYVQADITDDNALQEAINRVDTVFLLSGRTGIGTSIDHPGTYYRDNAVSLLQLLKQLDEGVVERVIAASTLHVYGEGKYRCDRCGIVYPSLRPADQLQNGEWEHRCGCGDTLVPVAVHEQDPINPQDPYSRSKLLSEHLVQDMVPDTVDWVTLRYPVVYGPRQGGAADYFFSTILDGGRPRLFEDGRQRRDFLFVGDVAAATVDAMQWENGIYNIGSGTSIELKTFVDHIISAAGKNLTPRIPGDFRTFDVRHTVADTNRFETTYQRPRTALPDGINTTLAAYQGGE